MKIVFLCHFSNPIVRESLKLKSYSFRNKLYGLKGISIYNDFAIWVSEYISEFENHPEFEFHIVAPHRGMKNEFENYDYKGVHYHFFKCNGNLLYDTLNAKLKIEENNSFRNNREKIRSVIMGINPDLVILCGAENPYYSIGVLDIINVPVYVILQTFLNDSKRIEMGVGTPYRRKIEIEIFRHAHYYCTNDENAINKIKEVNCNAVVLPAGFPTHRPVISTPPPKEYDFVFFARYVKKNKGIEDLLHALALVKKYYSEVRLDVIGECSVDYKRRLDEQINSLMIENNVVFAGYYDNINDAYYNVAKARCVVVPGITAGLNSTVRESMLMGLPTICYESSASEIVNKDNCCLITAKMEDAEDLAKQMIYVLDYPEQAETIAKNGMDYADRVFSNEAIVNKLLDNCRKIIEKEV